MEQLSKDETLALRKKHIGNSCKLFFKNDPIKIVRARGQYMFDEHDRPYLDCINNVAHVGHCHPDVVSEGFKQMGILNTNTRFLHDNIVLCAQRLISTMPEELSVCYFVNSGSEANDLALRLAQTHTGNQDIITLEQGYHGHLTSLIDISHYKFNQPGGPAKKDHVHVAPCPDVYRGKYRNSTHTEEELGILYADEIRQICEKLQSQKKSVCAYIAESLLGSAGQITLPKNYLREVYKHVRYAGGICIADEVQVGFGRVGKHWWAFQAQGEDVVPDIVTMGKPMGNGHPVAAVITTRAIAESFNKTGVEYFNTYGGNPVSCAIANAVFDIIEKEKLREHATDIGEHIYDRCRALHNHQNVIGDIRGMGLFLGIELVSDRNKRSPDKQLAEFVVERMKEKHILLSNDGPDGNVLKLKPPMVFTMKNANEFVTALNDILNEAKENESLLQENLFCQNYFH